MSNSTKISGTFGFRLQGTDGIRREVKPALSAEVAGLSPQRAFLERGFITEEFMELYVYAHLRQLADRGELKPGGAVVMGWDPRDVEGAFTGAAIRGARKAGADILCLGVVPTPLVPIYMLHENACCGFMITASHNPRDQNGIKTFHSFRGLKLLPHNDAELTESILALDYKTVAEKPVTGSVRDCREEALDLFERFSLDPENSWAPPASFGDVSLVVDPANGSLSGIAAGIFRRAGFGRVIETNNEQNGDVNLRSGVADLEGHKIVTAGMIARGSGLFSRHKAITKLFELGRKYRRQIAEGARRVSGAVFDADGDRFYRLDYHPFRDALLVLGGDETAFLQARYLMARDPKRYKGTAYVNTVESDLNAGLAAEQLGLKLHLAAVGDKWILMRVAAMIAESRIRSIGLKRRLAAARRSGIFDVRRFRDMEGEIDRLTGANGKSRNEPEHVPLAVGSEETGHNITLGRLGETPVFFGNGLKSALNSFAATHYLLGGKSARAYFSSLERPFKPGFKQTHYAYYIRKELFYRDSAVWKKVKRSLLDEGKKLGYHCKLTRFQEDADMLYAALEPARGAKNRPGRAAVFVRNSGTENKIGVNLRGDKKAARKLQAIGERIVRLLIAAMKDDANHFYKLELEVLSEIAAKPLRENQIRVSPRDRTRVLSEMKKQDLVRLTPQGYRLSARGKWYISSKPLTAKRT